MKYWDSIVNLMDDDMRERVHGEMAPCAEQEFLSRYLEYCPEFEDVIRGEFDAETIAAFGL